MNMSMATLNLIRPHLRGQSHEQTKLKLLLLVLSSIYMDKMYPDETDVTKKSLKQRFLTGNYHLSCN